MKKVLICGADGDIGRYLVEYFYARRHEHNITIVTADLNKSAFLEQRSEFYQVDTRKKERTGKFSSERHLCGN